MAIHSWPVLDKWLISSAVTGSVSKGGSTSVKELDRDRDSCEFLQASWRLPCSKCLPVMAVELKTDRAKTKYPKRLR